MFGLCAVLPFVVVPLATTAAPQEPVEEPRAAVTPSAETSARPTVDYHLRVRLVPAESGPRLEGRMVVTWTNPGRALTDELRWHVYNNAWSSPESLWLREARGFGSPDAPRKWGVTEVTGVHLLREDGAAGPDLDWEYLAQPGAPEDRTVARTALPQAIAPGASVTVELEFVTELPPAYRRSGWGSDGYIHAVQWFPKLGVFESWDSDRDGEEEWAWNCLPYHYLTEFYADYGSYEVELALPEEYEEKVVATGSMVEGFPRAADGEVVYLFRAENVHDFAWTGDPEAELLVKEFREEQWRDTDEEQRVARALGLAVEELRPTPVTMYLLLQPEHAEYADRYFTAIAKSIYYFGLWYGAYPYPTVSCVDPANDARATGGMEYPRLFTGGVSKGNHERTLSPEGVTVHEFGHQFWYGLVGNDEFHHAWMDEGFNTFSTQRVLAKGWPPSLATYSVLGRQFPGRAPLRLPSYGEGDPRGLLGLERWESPDLRLVPALSAELRRRSSLESWIVELPPVTYWDEVPADPMHRRRFSLASDWSEPLAHPTYDIHERGMSRINAYDRPALTLETMARLMGEDRWTRLLRDYHLSWRYRHPRPEDFYDKLLEHGGSSAMEAGDQEITVDWADFWRQAYHGEERVDFAAHALRNLPREDGSFDVHVGVRRLGGFRVPVEIRVTFEDGSTIDFVWDGQDPVWSRALEAWPQRAIRLHVDPRRRLALDGDWLNNELAADRDDTRAGNAALRVLLWAQQVLYYYGGAG